MTQLVDRVEDPIDDLEQAAFIASLIPPDMAANVLAPLADLCTAALAGTEAAASGAECGCRSAGGPPWRRRGRFGSRRPLGGDRAQGE